MSMESLRRGGYLSVKTDGDKSEIEVAGTKYDLVFNLTLLTMAVADNLNLPVGLLLAMVAEQTKPVKEEINTTTAVNMELAERMMGRGGNQES